MKKLTSVLLFVIYLLSACSNHNRADFVGEWRSEVGNSYIYLYEDGTASGRFEPDVFFDESIDKSSLEIGFISQEKFDQLKNDTITFDRQSGKWSYEKDESSGRYEINIWDRKAIPRPLNISFIISGSGGFRISKPFFIFRYKGDPDEDIRFIFKKIEK